MATTYENGAPVASRPHIPGYGIPETDEGMLPWSHVTERLARAAHYWVDTVDSDGAPHATPIWGAFVDGSLYFEGSPGTRRGRNLADNPNVVVHLEDGWEPVIIEGTAEEVKDPPRDLAGKLVEDMAAKYEERWDYRPSPDQWKEGGLYRVRPRVVFAWTQFPKDCTRFTFAPDSL